MKEKPSPESPRMAQLAEIRRMFDCAAEMRGVAEMLHAQAVMRLSGVMRSIKVDYETLSLRVRNLRRVGSPNCMAYHPRGRTFHGSPRGASQRGRF